MKTKQTLWLLCLSAAFGLSACGGSGDAQAPAQPQQQETQPASGQSAMPQAETESTPAAAQGDFLSSAEALQAAEDALKALPQFGGKAINIFQDAQFHGGSNPRIEIDVQDPNNPENIDHYTYRDGRWSEPQPVQISGSGNMKDNVTPLADIKFATVAAIAQTWAEKAKEVEAVKTEMDYAIFQLLVSDQTRRWVTSPINAPRAKYSAMFNLDGSLKDFKKQ